MTEQKNKLKVMCVTHGKDVDGCVSASILKLATNSNFLLTNYGGIDKSLKRIKDIYDIVYICDLGINETIIEELKRIRSFSELVYIDHHHLDPNLVTQLRDIGVEIVHDLKDCASVLTFNLFKDKIPIIIKIEIYIIKVIKNGHKFLIIIRWLLYGTSNL